MTPNIIVVTSLVALLMSQPVMWSGEDLGNVSVTPHSAPFHALAWAETTPDDLCVASFSLNSKSASF
jgi:hypothetical protein